jgi:hypothetical protein
MLDVPTGRGAALLPEVAFGTSEAHRSMVLARTAGGLFWSNLSGTKIGTQLIGRIANDVNRILLLEYDSNINCFNKMENCRLLIGTNDRGTKAPIGHEIRPFDSFIPITTW